VIEMYVDERAIALVAEHRYDLRKLAEGERLAALVRAGADSRPTFHCRALAWLGRAMIHWGQDLIEHCGTVASTQPLRPAGSIR